MRLLKIVTSFLVFCLLFSVLVSPSLASGEFTINFDTKYKVQENGSTEVTQDISIINNVSEIYATDYTLVVEGDKPEEIRAFQDGKTLSIASFEETSKTRIKVEFSDAVVGKGNSRTFSIVYKLDSVAMQNGQVWDISVPKLLSPENIENMSLTLEIPSSFGNPAYISPSPREERLVGESLQYIFYKEDLEKAGIAASFGEFQVFSFNLKYHLKNPLKKMAITEVALPPDTAFQRVYYEKVEPGPQSINLDEDGNWLATYLLEPEQKLDISVSGAAQLFAKPQKNYAHESPVGKGFYLTETKYWQVNDPEIVELAKSFEGPRAIYDFVVNNLAYNYARVKEGVQRLGAKQALASPDLAICMEYTDLFISLARAKGIPAREVNGFAYTESPEIQPLSLVADVLHAWPEYWDEKLELWRPVDPTWENTTGGIDYFGNFDLSHITFAIHGKDDSYPLPAGSYKLVSEPQKDVEVKFGELPQNRNAKIEFSFASPRLVLPFTSNPIRLTVKNSGTTAAYDIPVTIQSQGVRANASQEKIEFLPPFGKREILLSFKLPVKPDKNDKKIFVSAADSSSVYNISGPRTFLLQVTALFSLLLLPASAVALARYLRRSKKKQTVETKKPDEKTETSTQKPA